MKNRIGLLVGVLLGFAGHARADFDTTIDPEYDDYETVELDAEYDAEYDDDETVGAGDEGEWVWDCGDDGDSGDAAALGAAGGGGGICGWVWKKMTTQPTCLWEEAQCVADETLHCFDLWGPTVRAFTCITEQKKYCCGDYVQCLGHPAPDWGNPLDPYNDFCSARGMGGGPPTIPVTPL